MVEGSRSFHYYAPKIKNFGDHLNEWLFKELGLLGFNYPTLGIGSILTNEFLNHVGLQTNAYFILGSGARSNDHLANQNIIEGSFVRGPYTASVTGNKHPFITDGAYLIRQTDWFNRHPVMPKKYDISIMPYFRSMPYIDSVFLNKLGIHIIDPRIPHGIEFALKEIMESRVLISEAMHGAIFSDIFRVPWVRLNYLSSAYEGTKVSEFKWNDWLASIKMTDCPSLKVSPFIPFIGSITNYTLKNHYLNALKTINVKRLNNLLAKHVHGLNYCMSSNEVIAAIDAQMSDVLNKLRNDQI